MWIGKKIERVCEDHGERAAYAFRERFLVIHPNDRDIDDIVRAIGRHLGRSERTIYRWLDDMLADLEHRLIVSGIVQPRPVAAPPE